MCLCGDGGGRGFKVRKWYFRENNMIERPLYQTIWMMICVMWLQ